MKVSLIPVILKVCFSMLRTVKPLISSLLLRGEAEQARAGPGTFRPPLAGSPGATFPQTAQMSLREANHSLGIWILNTVVAVKPWLWGVLQGNVCARVWMGKWQHLASYISDVSSEHHPSSALMLRPVRPWLILMSPQSLRHCFSLAEAEQSLDSANNFFW